MARKQPTDQTRGTDDRLRIAFRTLGCRLNQFDTEVMRAALQAAYPVDVVAWNDEADLYVLNSCTVTGKADQECRRLARQVKRRHRTAKVVVAGCYAQTQPGSLTAVPEIDAVIGNAIKEDAEAWLPQLLAASDGPVVRVEPIDGQSALHAPLIDRFADRSRAFVKVQDGCDLRCSYCAIWRARGPARSRPAAEVLEQIGRLARAGYRELVLTGVNLGRYGRDLDNGAAATGLAALAERCADRYPALRFRLGSLHPDEITDRLLELLAHRRQLRPHLHISLQSGSDSVLDRMRRPYDSSAARRAVERASAAVPGCAIGADLIVGFPDESDDEFAATERMVADLPFSYLHVFRYSPRPGTAAAEMTGTVHPETVTARGARLRRLGLTKEGAFRAGQIGRWCEAVVEGYAGGDGNGGTAARSGNDWRCATTARYVSALVPAGWQAGDLVSLLPVAERDGRLLAKEVVAVE
jgi:threonylcarbamoyladenosine tRNA methylthiotransferase MtaB